MQATEQSAVRIGGTFARGAFRAIESFLRVMSRPEFKGYSLKEIADQVEHTFEYDNAASFYTDAMNRNITSFDSVGMHNDQMEKFSQLANQYNIKYLYEVKPENLDELIKKPIYSDQDRMIINQWTTTKDDVIIPIEEDFKITFAEKDIPKMEMICKDLLTYEQKKFKDRVQNAVKTEKQQPKKQRTKTKAKQKEKLKEVPVR